VGDAGGAGLGVEGAGSGAGALADGAASGASLGNAALEGSLEGGCARPESVDTTNALATLMKTKDRILLTSMS
jgi:hypothetical protein